jgi:hypothetical protein
VLFDTQRLHYAIQQHKRMTSKLIPKSQKSNKILSPIFLSLCAAYFEYTFDVNMLQSTVSLRISVLYLLKNSAIFFLLKAFQ